MASISDKQTIWYHDALVSFNDQIPRLIDDLFKGISDNNVNTRYRCRFREVNEPITLVSPLALGR